MLVDYTDTNIELSPEMGQFELHQAACRGQLDALKILIKMIKIDATRSTKRINVLQVATRHGRLNCVRYLIEKGHFCLREEGRKF